MKAHSTITAGRGLTSTCASDQSAKLHIIGCRVIANTPRAGCVASFSLPGAGSAGLRTNEPSRRILAASMMTVEIIHSPSPTLQSGVPDGAARKAITALPNVVKDTAT